MKLSYKIALLFGALFLLLGTISIGAFYGSIELLLMQKGASGYQYRAVAAFTSIDQFLYERFLQVQQSAQQQFFIGVLTNPGSASARSAAGAQAREVIMSDPRLGGIDVIDARGMVVASDNSTREGYLLGSDVVEKNLLVRALSGASAYSDIHNFERFGGPGMEFIAPVTTDRKNVMGAVVLFVPVDPLNDILKEAKVPFAHLLDAGGLEIGNNGTSSNQDILTEDYRQNEAYQTIAADPSMSGFKNLADLHGKFTAVTIFAREAGYRGFVGNKWLLVFEVPVDALLAPARSAAFQTTAFLLVFFILLSVLLFIVVRRFTGRIGSLSEGVGRVLQGDWSGQVPEAGNDEIADLGHTFNRLAQKLHAEEDALESRVAEKTKELESELLEKEYQNKILEDTKKATLNLLEDLSVEKSKSDAIASELNKFQLAVENANEHMIITDPDGKIVYGNPASERITGYSRAEILGQTPALWGHQMSREFYEKMWHTIKIEKSSFVGQLTNRRKDGALYDVDARITPILGANGRILFFLGIERDITGQKKLEDARKNFISVASHQLRTPLTSIKWITELLLEGDMGKLNDRQQEFVNDLSVSAQRMVDLVNSLLNIARIESEELKMKSVDTRIKEVYEIVLKDMQAITGPKKQKIAFEEDGAVPRIKTDPEILYEILENILSNAVKYTPEGGSIRTRVASGDSGVTIEVSDTGIGIPQNQQSRMFERFFRGDNAIKAQVDGTGLGMYIVKGLLDLIGGNIRFISIENKGTTFVVTLPLQSREGTGTKALIRMG